MVKTFWLVLSIACIAWYLAVLGYVAVKGGGDIKEMLKNLSDNQDRSE
jgi:hypothetical protein